LQWARENSDADPDLGLALASALGWYWYVGRQGEGRFELRSMLEACTAASSRTRARALQALSLSLRPAGCIVHASPEAAEVARESKAIFDEVGDPAGSAMSQLLVAVEGVAGVEVDSSLIMVEEARVRLRDHGEDWGVALADFVEMEIRLYHDSTDEALVLGEQAARQFDALDDNWGRSAVRLHLGFGLRQAGRTREARQVLHEAVAISRDTGLPYNLARSLAELGELAVYEGDTDEAERWFRECDEILADLADDAMQALVASGRGDAARYRSEPSAAIDLYNQALSLYRRSAVTRGIARALIGLAAASLDLNRSSQARAHLEEGLTLARDAGDPAILAAALEELARLSQRDDDDHGARALLAESEDLRLRYRRPRGALATRDLDPGRTLLNSEA
jgi:tetratricopeptide (TPR) repeat protein